MSATAVDECLLSQNAVDRLNRCHASTIPPCSRSQSNRRISFSSNRRHVDTPRISHETNLAYMEHEKQLCALEIASQSGRGKDNGVLQTRWPMTRRYGLLLPRWTDLPIFEDDSVSPRPISILAVLPVRARISEICTLDKITGSTASWLRLSWHDDG